MAYATLVQLAEYMGVLPETLSPDAARLLERASELVDFYTCGNSSRASELQEPYLVKAVCAQVKKWLESGEGEDTERIESYSIGKVSVRYAAGASQKAQPLSDAATRHLWLGGLLNRRGRAL